MKDLSKVLMENKDSRLYSNGRVLFWDHAELYWVVVTQLEFADINTGSCYQPLIQTASLEDAINVLLADE